MIRYSATRPLVAAAAAALLLAACSGAPAATPETRDTATPVPITTAPVAAAPVPTETVAVPELAAYTTWPGVAEALLAGLRGGEVANGAVLLNQERIDAAQAAGFKIYTPPYSEKKFHIAIDPAQPLPEHVKTLVIAGEVDHLERMYTDRLPHAPIAMPYTIRSGLETFARVQGNRLGRNLVIVYPTVAAADQSAMTYDLRSAYSWEVTIDKAFWLRDANGNPVDDNGDAARQVAENWVAKQSDPGSWDVITMRPMAPLPENR